MGLRRARPCTHKNDGVAVTYFSKILAASHGRPARVCYRIASAKLGSSRASGVKRRGFIGGIAGMAVGWSLAAQAQQPERVRRVGVLFGAGSDDPDVQARLVAFRQVLQQLTWIDGHNVRIDARFAGGNV